MVTISISMGAPSVNTERAVSGLVSLSGISCTSSGTDCYAVGIKTNSLIGEYVQMSNGSGLPGSVQTAAGTEFLNGVVCPNDETCYATGATSSGSGAIVPITVSSGASGAPVIVGSTSELFGVACASITGCYTGASSSNGGAMVPFTVPPALALNVPTIVAGTAGSPYAGVQFTAGGGSPPWTFSLAGGTSTGIDGLMVNSMTGELSGTPLSAGSFSGFGVTVTDSTGQSVTSAPLTLVVVPASCPTTTTLYWNGSGGVLDDGWDSVPNWTNLYGPPSIPAQSDNVCLPSNSALYTVDLTGVGYAATVVIGTGATLEIDANSSTPGADLVIDEAGTGGNVNRRPI